MSVLNSTLENACPLIWLFIQTVKVYFEGGYQDTTIYLLEKLKPEQMVAGPAIIMDSLSTILVEPG